MTSAPDRPEMTIRPQAVGVADFDAALRDPAIPTQMRAADDCGDGLHPSDAGYCKMGDAIDLALLA